VPEKTDKVEDQTRPTHYKDGNDNEEERERENDDDDGVRYGRW
jgi:hypothetical protein